MIKLWMMMVAASSLVTVLADDGSTVKVVKQETKTGGGSIQVSRQTSSHASSQSGSQASSQAIASSSGGSQSAAKVALSGDKAAASVQIQPGGTVEISLEGNPTTGYSWFVVTPADPKILLVSDIKYTQNKAPARMVGVGGSFTLTAKGLAKGKTTLAFEYKRPWEKNTPAIRTATVEVTVQ
jgi:inhibitor of cysteine peptidase